MTKDAQGSDSDVDGRSSIAALHRRIKGQLSTSEQLIEALKKQLAECRERNKALVQERNDLMKSIAQIDASRALRDGQEGQARRQQRREADSSRQALQRENEELSRRCLELEETLADRRREAAEAVEEIACLEEQVSQLQSMVDLLCEHLEIEGPELEQLLESSGD